MKTRISVLLLLMSIPGAALLSGCSANFQPSPVTDWDTGRTSIGEINGSVHGGQSPITGAQIYLFAAATNGYAAASQSLITSGKPGVTCNTSGTLNGDCYVLTNGLGNFSVGGDYTCTPGTQVYMVAAGGNPGVGTAAPFSTTATVTKNANTITVASATGITTGMAITGTGIAAGATVTKIVNRTITLSQNSTASGTNVSVTFSTTTATWAANSWTVTVTSAANVSVGDVVAGSGVNGTVTAVNGTTIALSQPLATSGSSVPVMFSTAPPSNTAIVQMIGLGQCPAAGNLAAQVPYLVINEVTTVAFAYAMGGFGTDAYHIGSSGTPQALTAIANAMTNFTNIVGIGWGGALPVTNVNPNSVAPQAKINMLANIIATCVNTAVSTSGSCTNLFANAKNGTATPTDEATALFNIVHNPDANASAIFGLYSGNSIFSPALGSAPKDWTMPIVYKSVVSSRPGNISFDSSGNAWISDRTNNAVVKMSPQGDVTKLTNLNSGSANGSIYEVAVDSGNNIWALDYTNSQIYRLYPTGAWESTITGNQLSAPVSISFDSAGDAVVLNSSNTQISRFSSSGLAQNPAAYNQTTNGQGSLGTPITIASDSAGNVFIPANGGCACVGVLGNTNLAAITYTDWSNTLGNATASAMDSTSHVWQAQTNNTIVQAPTYASNSYQYYDNTLFGFQLFVGYYFDATNFFFGYPFGMITPTTLSNGGLSAPDSVAFDGNGYIWAANSGASTVSGFNGTTALSTTGFQTGSAGVTYGAAPDLSGNVWTVNSDGTVTQILGLATPTATPVYPGQIAVKP